MTMTDSTTVRHHRIRTAAIVGACALALVGLYIFWAPVSNTVAGGYQNVQNFRNSWQTPAATAELKTPAVSTELVKTSDDRAVYRQTTRVDIDPVTELANMKAALAAAQENTKQQLASITTSLTNAVSGLRDDLKKQATPAPAPVASAQATPAPQAAAAPAAPAAQQTAQANGNIGLVIPKGFHLVGAGDEANQAKMRTCHRQLVLDTSSPKCFRDRQGNLTCPWKCP